MPLERPTHLTQRQIQGAAFSEPVRIIRTVTEYSTTTMKPPKLRRRRSIRFARPSLAPVFRPPACVSFPRLACS